VRVRQMPGSAKSVMFITIEDETGIANLVIWPKVFEHQRHVILSAAMMAARGRIQREGEVVHLVAHQLADLSPELATVGERDIAFPLPHGRGDQVRHGGSGPDPRDAKGLAGPQYLRPLWPYRPDQGEDARFPIASQGPRVHRVNSACGASRE